MDIITKYRNFRRLCLVNAEDAIKTAVLLVDKNVNHIAFQLAVLGLEEIGKIFVGWYNLNSTETWGKENYNIPIDDHIKKLFWAIWGPSFGNEKFSKEQMDEIKGFATKLHNKRLDVMYTELTDTIPSSQKITTEELGIYLNMAKSRLELAKNEGEEPKEPDAETELEIQWFMGASDHPEKRNFIFTSQSQEKLIEFGAIKPWIKWLRNHFETEQAELTQLLQKELEKASQNEENKREPKWRIKFKVITPSHSIRANVLNKFSSKSFMVKFAKGADTHTLIIDIILDKKTKITDLWHHGWNASNILVAALNIATNGLFYWNISVDVDKFYDQIWDLENNQRLEAKLDTSLKLDWSSKNMYLREEELALTFLIFRYFGNIFSSEDFEPVWEYQTALGMLAKNDMHLRLEPQCLLHFFLSFKKALMRNENCTDAEVKEVGYKMLEKMIIGRDEYDKVIDLAIELEKNNAKITTMFSLTEVIAMKQYSGLYLTTLAVRHKYGDKTLLLTK